MNHRDTEGTEVGLRGSVPLWFLREGGDWYIVLTSEHF
jgi:hypothetical protein